MRYEELLKEVRSKLKKEDFNRIVYQQDSELEADFLGFLESYDQLRKIASKDFIIVDLGCYLAPQSYLFEGYEKYIGVDIEDSMERFSPENAVHYHMSIQRFIKEKMNEMDLDKTFAVCSYVPDADAVEKAKKTFKNILVIYPGTKTFLKINDDAGRSNGCTEIKQ